MAVNADLSGQMVYAWIRLPKWQSALDIPVYHSVWIWSGSAIHH